MVLQGVGEGTRINLLNALYEDRMLVIQGVLI
jgi:hypothetical protein